MNAMKGILIYIIIANTIKKRRTCEKNQKTDAYVNQKAGKGPIYTSSQKIINESRNLNKIYYYSFFLRYYKQIIKLAQETEITSFPMAAITTGIRDNTIIHTKYIIS